ncbi:DUF4148 domain-containing protein [Ideonella sp. BN130291]|uniref:DUF4148 domain-containing protein n=1 Tax=Ideonella sp. BN130291 TaxID=3112940 RepID=UPI002E269EBD|nr:DUF4148 domain-containing protein [Ideonella sp. BN130291]
MKKLSIAALMMVVAGAALADDITPDTYRDAVATKSRAQVLAERDQAKRDGTINAWSTRYNPLSFSKSLKTRDQVVAELKAAQASGEYAAMNSEDSGALAQARAPRGNVYVASQTTASK